MSTSKKLLSLPGPGAVGGLAVDKNNGTRVFASSAADGYIVQVSPEDQEVQGYVKTGGLVLPLGLTATLGNQIFLGDYSTLRVVDTRRNRVTKSVTQTIKGFVDGTGVAAPFTVAAFGQHLVLSDWLDRLIQVYDPVNHVALANINTRFLGFGSPLNAIEYRGETGAPPSILAAHYVPPTRPPLFRPPDSSNTRGQDSSRERFWANPPYSSNSPGWLQTAPATGSPTPWAGRFIDLTMRGLDPSLRMVSATPEAWRRTTATCTSSKWAVSSVRFNS